MKNSPIYKDQSLVNLELSVHATELLNLADEYLSSFERSDLFSFSKSEERNKSYKLSHYDFAAKASSVIGNMNDSAAKLSNLLALADQSFALDLTVLIGKKINAYLALEQKIGEYFSDCKKLIAQSTISPSLLISKTQKLRFELEGFLAAIRDE